MFSYQIWLNENSRLQSQEAVEHSQYRIDCSNVDGVGGGSGVPREVRISADEVEQVRLDGNEEEKDNVEASSSRSLGGQDRHDLGITRPDTDENEKAESESRLPPQDPARWRVCCSAAQGTDRESEAKDEIGRDSILGPGL